MGLGFSRGDHICGLYETEREQRAMATAFLVEGLRAGERCFYVADSRAALDRFRMSLAIAGLDAGAQARSGAYLEATKTDTYLINGRFDCERMLGLLADALDVALRDGFPGLRACGDMSWLLDEFPGSDRLVEYEARINEAFQGEPVAWLCQYDRRRLPADLIDHALATHPSAVLDGRHLPNSYYEPLATAMKRLAQPNDLDLKLSELRRLF